MISKLIVKYLKTHRRVNIPSVGAFMVKGDEGREIIFSELLKNDDGVLNILLRQQGLSEIESAAQLDRFVFELRHSTEEQDGEFVIEGIGTLHRECGGRLGFTPTPHTNEAASEGANEGAEKETTEEVNEVTETKETTPEQTETTIEPQQDRPTKERADETQSQSRGSSRYTTERIKELYSRPQAFRESESVIKDLEYSQQRQKPLGGYSYVRKRPSKQGVDKVLLFGVLAAFIALSAIAYGYYVANIEEVTDFLIKLGLTSVE